MTDSTTGQIQQDAVRRDVVARLSDQLDGPSEPCRSECDARSGPARHDDIVVEPPDGSTDDDDHTLRVRAAPSGMSAGPGPSA